MIEVLNMSLLIAILFALPFAWGNTQPNSTPSVLPTTALTVEAYCNSLLKRLPKQATVPEAIEPLCKNVQTLKECTSAENRPIFHYDVPGSGTTAEKKKILVLGLIHGDETWSGTLVQVWMARLLNLSPKNEWRFIPVTNPDGFIRKTRMNAHGIDLNRNFPTKEWKKNAHSEWKRTKDRRRFPGQEPGSEPEVQCVLKQISDYNPDLVVSVHTPYGVLDYDGPKHVLPRSRPLPWKSLGTFEGSLGRYLWSERSVPVLTVELKGDDAKTKRDAWIKLQDELSFLAQKMEKN